MDRDKLIEEIAIIIHEGFRSDVKAGAMADDVLSLLAPVFEKAERWDAYQTDLINEKAHTERFIKLMDAEEGELRRKAEKWRKVEEINNTCDGCLFHINYSCYYDGGCPFAVVLYALTDKEAT